LRLGEPLYRPFVPIALAYGDQTTFQLTGLIDTGADSVLVSDYLAEQLGVDLNDHEGETTLGVGGHVVAVRYKTVSLRLYPRGEDDLYREWQAPVGFIPNWHSYGFVLLGSIGFLDQFTITASRFSQAVAVEHRDAFDDRFGPVLVT
jgi:Aspartyl protease